MAEQDLTSPLPHVVRIRCGDEGEIDRERLGRMERAQPRDVRLELAQTLGPDLGDTRHAVGTTAPVQLVEPRELRLVGGDDHLAAAQHGDLSLLAVADQPFCALRAETRLERARRVVDATVDDPAGTAGLVQADLRLLVEDGDPQARMSQRQRARRRQAQDAGAHDGDVGSVAHRPSVCTSRA